MINRRSVPALHRACLHLRQQLGQKPGWNSASGILENGHDSGLVQSVFRSPARTSAAESQRRSLYAAPPNEKRSSLSRANSGGRGWGMRLGLGHGKHGGLCCPVCYRTDFRDAQAIDFIGKIFRLISYPLMDASAYRATLVGITTSEGTM